MRITGIRHLRVPLEGNVSNAMVSFADHDVSLVAVASDVVRDGRRVTGIAFNSIGRYAQPGLIDERFAPRLLAAPAESLLDGSGSRFDPAAIGALLMRNEKPGGHGDRAGAVAALELAIWDLNAKLEGVPAADLIAREFGRAATRPGVPVYAAGGYYRDEYGTSALTEELAGYRDAGYGVFKIKIGGALLADDLRRIEAALTVTRDPSQLAVDANGRFDLDTALSYGKELEPYSLAWYEEPGDPLDYDLNRAVAEIYSGPIATGENLFSRRDATNLVRHGGMRPGLDVFQMDAGISYGLTEYAGMIADLESAGHSRTQARPHGGHLINLHIVHGLELGGCEAYPGVFQPFGGYSPGVEVVDGRIAPTAAPGFGLEEKPELRPLISRLLG
ncbi:enolase C-terminal domain-like protein [Pseudonocardia nematodicida]|uniref:Enolase C-terminal domain-like protein n=1 Tax=Pseudonocardia nematodicida TaxID=1206997 RepID=A0ABV1KE89_9PSEU